MLFLRFSLTVILLTVFPVTEKDASSADSAITTQGVLCVFSREAETTFSWCSFQLSKYLINLGNGLKQIYHSVVDYFQSHDGYNKTGTDLTVNNQKTSTRNDFPLWSYLSTKYHLWKERFIDFGEQVYDWVTKDEPGANDDDMEQVLSAERSPKDDHSWYSWDSIVNWIWVTTENHNNDEKVDEKSFYEKITGYVITTFGGNNVTEKEDINTTESGIESPTMTSKENGYFKNIYSLFSNFFFGNSTESVNNRIIQVPSDYKWEWPFRGQKVVYEQKWYERLYDHVATKHTQNEAENIDAVRNVFSYFYNSETPVVKEIQIPKDKVKWMNMYQAFFVYSTSSYKVMKYNMKLLHETMSNNLWLHDNVPYFSVLFTRPAPKPLGWKDYMFNTCYTVFTIVSDYYEYISMLSVGLVIVIININYLLNKGKSHDDDYDENFNIDLVDYEFSTIANYKLLKIIGSGGLSSVYAAKSIFGGFRDLFAIKVMAKRRFIQNYDSERARKLCKSTGAEVYVSRLSLESKYIAGLVASYQLRTHIAIVMPCYKGGSLSDQLKIRDCVGFNEAEVFFFAAELVCAIQFLHSKGILHNDLKPGNVLIDMNGHLLLSDFGSASHVEKEGRFYGEPGFGTMGFMAPELILGQEYGFPADFFSLGATLYFLHDPPSVPFGFPEIPTGVRTSNSQTRGEVGDYIERVLSQDYDKTEDISEMFYSFISALVLFDPSERLGSVSSSLGLIRNHDYFMDVNWHAIEFQAIPPPFIPTELEYYSDIMDPNLQASVPVLDLDLEVVDDSRFEFLEEFFEDIATFSDSSD